MVGFGYDVHKLAPGENLVLAGVVIPSPIGTVAHSDGDVVYHALVDAILGALALGDIGEHFPDTDPKWKGAASILFVEHAIKMIANENCVLINVDVTLVLELPKILPYKLQMRQNIADVCKLPLNRVGFKATTSERVGFVGRSEGVQAYCICEIQSNA